MSAAEKIPQVERLLTRREVESRTGLGRSTIYERMAAGTFPLARKDPVSASVRWVESEVAAWIADWISRAQPVGTVVGRKSEGKKKAA